MTAFNVYARQGSRKLIDTVFYSGGSFTADDVRRSLIEHDGYAPEIHVTKARGPAKTRALYVVQQYYPDSGWEDVTASNDMAEAKADARAYRANAPEYATRMVTRREPIEA